MKDPPGRTKVVLRHLPPAISRSALMDQIDARFAGRYKWASFLPGKTSHKNQRHSRAYIDFTSPEDVVEFAEFFDGHIFVSEKGAQFKTLVEYAPSQRIPKACLKKDGREGTILKDPEYLEFLEHLAKPVENLPSAEIQLERKEAERVGGGKETLVVTPLMDFVRQKRAVKMGSQQRSSTNGKPSRRIAGASVSSSGTSSKRSSEKRRLPASMYVVRDGSKTASVKDKSAFILMPRRESQPVPDRAGVASTASGTEVMEEENVHDSSGTSSLASGNVEIGKRLVLLKGKERETAHQQNQVPSVRISSSSTASKHVQQDASGRLIRSILSNKEARLSQSYMGTSHSEQQIQTLALEKDKRPPRPPNSRLVSKDSSRSSTSLASADNDGKRHQDDKVALNDLHGSLFISGEKHEKRMRNKDRPDRGVWTLRRSEFSHGSDETSVSADVLSDTLEGISVSQQALRARVGDGDKGIHNTRAGRGNNASYDMAQGPGETKPELQSLSRNAEARSTGVGRSSLTPVENGSHRHVGRRGPAHGLKEADGILSLSDGKPSKRGPSGYGHHERQVWVQKSGSAS